MCQDEELYSAVLVLGHISRFWAEGELSFSSGWYINVLDLKLLSPDKTLETIRGYAPVGSLFEEEEGTNKV